MASFVDMDYFIKTAVAVRAGVDRRALPHTGAAPCGSPRYSARSFVRSNTAIIPNCGENPLTTELVFRGYEKNKPVAHEILTGDDLNAVNSFEKPHQVGFRNAEILPEGQGGFSQTELSGNSWNRVQFVPG